jgi:dTDP-glucose 4,6-dehydratase
MNILVTGGAGFVGSHLCRKLLADGNSVICVDNLLTGTEVNIKDLQGRKNFVFINHDICRPLKIIDSLDWVMHFASPASPKDYLRYPIMTIKVGTLGTHVCLGIAKEHKAKFLLASTSEVYGDPKISPQPEEYWGNVNPVGPRSCYDEAKRAAEAFSFAYYREHNTQIHVSRIFNTYGPNMRIDDGRVISNFIVQAIRGEDLTVYGLGSQTRSFCFIDDLIEGITRFMLIDYPGPLNLGSTFEHTILELANKIIELTGSRSNIKHEQLPQDDPKQRKPDNSKAKHLLGWTPKINLDEGLKKTIRYFKEELGLL